MKKRHRGRGAAGGHRPLHYLEAYSKLYAPKHNAAPLKLQRPRQFGRGRR